MQVHCGSNSSCSSRTTISTHRSGDSKPIWHGSKSPEVENGNACFFVCSTCYTYYLSVHVNTVCLAKVNENRSDSGQLTFSIWEKVQKGLEISALICQRKSQFRLGYPVKKIAKRQISICNPWRAVSYQITASEREWTCHQANNMQIAFNRNSILMKLLTFWITNGDPYSAPPCNRKPHGCRSVLAKPIFTVWTIFTEKNSTRSHN